MPSVTVINRLLIKPGKMDEFIAAQRGYAATLKGKPNGLIGGRLYRSLDGKSAVLVSEFESVQAQEDIRQQDTFKAHVKRLEPLIESSSPEAYDVAYTTGNFK
jgi:quinol monooxygenase YgiN